MIQARPAAKRKPTYGRESLFVLFALLSQQALHERALAERLSNPPHYFIPLVSMIPRTNACFCFTSTAWAVMDLLKCVIRRHWSMRSCGPRFCPNCGRPSVSVVGRSRLLRAIYYNHDHNHDETGDMVPLAYEAMYPIVDCAGHKMLSHDPLSSERAEYLPSWMWIKQA